MVALVLLAYLYDKGQSISRRELTSLFWQGSREAAHTNLRSTLHRLALAIPQTLPSLIHANGRALSINRTSVHCDLSLVDLVDPMDRLRAANDAVAMQFLPSMGNGTTPLAGWVRDVRNRLAGHLRSELIRHHASFDTSALRAELRRAAILLLECDPADEEVRMLLTARLDASALRSPLDASAPMKAQHNRSPWWAKTLALSSLLPHAWHCCRRKRCKMRDVKDRLPMH